MRICPGCQRELADDAIVCECGMRFAEGAAAADPGGEVQSNAPSEPQANNTTDPQEQADLAEGDLDEVDLDEVDLDEVDLDTEEIDLAEGDLDMDSAEEFAVGQAGAEPEIPHYSRRQPPTPKKLGPMVVVIAAHAVIILAALCIFYQKNKSSGGGYDPDYDAAASQDYVTEPNTYARQVEEAVRGLGLPCRILNIVKESPASPEARVVLQKTTYQSKLQLREVVDTAAVRVGNKVFKLDERIRSVYVEVRAPLSRQSQTDPAITVTFDRTKVDGTMRGMSPRQILKFFNARYHPGLEQD